MNFSVICFNINSDEDYEDHCRYRIQKPLHMKFSTNSTHGSQRDQKELAETSAMMWEQVPSDQCYFSLGHSTAKYHGDLELRGS